MVSYHPSTVQQQTCQLTDGEVSPRCHSEGPCSSLATHLPCSPPVRVNRVIAQKKRTIIYKTFWFLTLIHIKKKIEKIKTKISLFPGHMMSGDLILMFLALS